MRSGSRSRTLAIKKPSKGRRGPADSSNAGNNAKLNRGKPAAGKGGPAVTPAPAEPAPEPARSDDDALSQGSTDSAGEAVELEAPATAGPEAEVTAAVRFIAGLLLKAIGEASAGAVGERLRRLLLARYAGHWHPAAPSAGCGYRCLMSTRGRLDPTIAAALAEVLGGRSSPASRAAAAALPGGGDFALFVDPGEVALRVGDRAPLTALYSAPAAGRAAAKHPDAGAARSRSLSPASRMSASARSFSPAVGGGATPPGTPEARRGSRAAGGGGGRKPLPIGSQFSPMPSTLSNMASFAPPPPPGFGRGGWAGAAQLQQRAAAC